MSVLYQEYQFWTLIMSFAYVRRYAPFSLAFHITVSDNAVSVRYAVLGSPSRNQICILSLYIETHRVFDTCGISTTNLVLTLRKCGLNKRMHYSFLDHSLKEDCATITISFFCQILHAFCPKHEFLRDSSCQGKLC